MLGLPICTCSSDGLRVQMSDTGSIFTVSGTSTPLVAPQQPPQPELGHILDSPSEVELGRHKNSGTLPPGEPHIRAHGEQLPA